MIAIISDEQLKAYLPSYGDRIAAKAFAKKCQMFTDRNDIQERKQTLMTKLDEKLATRVLRSSCKVGNMNAKREKRRVEIGWLDQQTNGHFKQVYERSGGGIKHESCDPDTSMAEIVTQAKCLFFPNDLSRRGAIELFDYFITDNTFEKLDGELTVGQLYVSKKVKLLRLYFATIRKNKTSEDDATSKVIQHPVKKSKKKRRSKCVPSISKSSKYDSAESLPCVLETISSDESDSEVFTHEMDSATDLQQSKQSDASKHLGLKSSSTITSVMTPQESENTDDPQICYENKNASTVTTSIISPIAESTNGPGSSYEINSLCVPACTLSWSPNLPADTAIENVNTTEETVHLGKIDDLACTKLVGPYQVNCL